MKFIKENKFTIIAIIIFIVLVVAGVKIKDLLVPDEGKAVYGDRLDEINKYELKTSLFSDMKTKLLEDTRILDFREKIHGKIINLMITVGDDVNINDAKSIANSTIAYFLNDELSYYTLQVYVLKNNEELNNFPIVGYKGTHSDTLVFSKDRDIVVSEEPNEE